MRNLKLRHLIPIFGVSHLDKLTPTEDFILIIYNLVVLSGTALGVAVLTFKYIL